MNKRQLGKSGIEVSAVGLGCNAVGGRIDAAASREVVHAALDGGITYFDTANSYGNRYGSIGGSESCLGELLGARRKEIVLATKFGCQSHKHPSIPVEGASRAEIMSAVHASLKRLRTDWIDLYQLHYPDPRTPIEETLRALDDLVQQGKVRHIGCSNFAAWQVADADWAARHLGVQGFVTCQREYSLLVRDARRELVPALAHYGVGLLPYYPLAAGLLTGKYHGGVLPAESRFAIQKRFGARFLTETNFAALERLERYGAERGMTLLELAFGWLLAQPVVSCVIAGATRAGQVTANLAAARRALTPEEMAAIEDLVAANDPETQAD
jgi:aryl-alcohol dehydrogenase-like predicted oxidoreductase